MTLSFNVIWPFRLRIPRKGVQRHVLFTDLGWPRGVACPNVLLSLKCNFIFSNIVPYNCNVSVWKWSSTMNIQSALWMLMTRDQWQQCWVHTNAFPVVYGLTHCDWKIMAHIFQMTFSNAFPWWEKNYFLMEFLRSLFIRVQLTITSQQWFR